jgi:hypothetical protein
MPKKFIKATLIRAGHTTAQTALGMIGTSVFISDIKWPQLLSAVGLATMVSILKSITLGLPEIDKEE